MAKEAIKKSLTAAGESVLRSLLPELVEELHDLRQSMEKRLTSMEQRLTKLEDSVHQVQIDLMRDLADKHERLLEVMTDFAQRIAHLEGRLGSLGNSIDRQTDRMELWIERTVRMETLQERQQPTRKRKAV